MQGVPSFYINPSTPKIGKMNASIFELKLQLCWIATTPANRVDEALVNFDQLADFFGDLFMRHGIFEDVFIRYAGQTGNEFEDRLLRI